MEQELYKAAAGLPDTERTFADVERSVLPNAPRHLWRRAVGAMACLCLLAGLGLGTYAYAAEAREYNAARSFFEQYSLPTDGLTRGDIKAVYRDIKNKSFNYEKTAGVIESSLTPEQKRAFEESKGGAASGDASELWDYKVMNSTNPPAGNSTVPPMPTQPTKPTKPIEMVKLHWLTFEVLPEYPYGYAVTKCLENAVGELVIPETVNGYPVIGIGKLAFHECTGITSVTIPDSVITIGGSAFSGCSKLANVTLSNNLTEVRLEAFKNCRNLKYNTYESSTYLGSATNPYMLLMKGPGTTSTQCTIHPDAKMIYSGAFASYSKLEKLVLPDGIRFIGYCAFEMCENLTDVTISAGLEKFEGRIFSSCPNLKAITYDNALYLGSADNPYAMLLKSVGTGITNCQIHPDTKIIHGDAFYENRNLTRITIPDSVVCVGREAFHGCTALTEVTWSSGCKAIQVSTFGGCSNLKNFAIPEGVTDIDLGAFDGCYNLVNVSIPSSMVYIDRLAFIECDRLVYNIYDNAKYLGNTENPYLVLMKPVSTDITQCQIHPEAKFIHTRAFAGCTKLTEIEIPDSVIVALDPFNECPALTKVTVGKGLAVWNTVFRGCDKLESIVVSKENPYFASDESGVLFTKDRSHLIVAPAMISGSYRVPDTVTVICGSAFDQCKKLTGITIGLGVKEMHFAALGDCPALVDIQVASGNLYYKTDEDGILMSIDGKEIIKAPASLSGHYTLPKGVTILASHAFYNCTKLESVTMPKKGIGVYDGNTEFYSGTEIKYAED